MFYRFINSGKFRFQRVIVNFIVVISYIFTLKGCMTTDISYVTPETIEPSTFENISLIILKSRITIDCKNKIVNLEKGNDSTFYFTVTPVAGGEGYKTNGEKQMIPVKDVLRIQLSESSLSDGSVALLIVGALAIGLIIAYAIAVSSMDFGFP